jgi:hypothetical protein
MMFWGAATGAGLIAAFGVGLLLGAPAKAADMPRKAPPAATSAGDRCAKVGPAPGTPVVPDGDIFGITSHADIGAPCSWSAASEITGHAGKRDGRYVATTNKMQISYTYSRDLAFAVSPFVTHNTWANVSSLQAVTLVNRFDTFQFDGLSGEVSYRLLDRGAAQPVAITVSAEPRWARVDSISGWRTESFGNEFKFLMDAALSDRLFAAFNLNYAFAHSRLYFPGATWVDSSSTNVSGALTAQVYAKEKASVESVFLGVEARFQSAFAGLMANRNIGNGFFVGPTMAIAFSGGWMLNMAWTPQLAGGSIPSMGPLDLDNFERHQFRVKFATPL